MSPEPISDEALRRLREEGCNADELSAYSGHEPCDALMRSYGGCWWLQLGQALGMAA